MKMEQTECSETSAYKLQTAGYYPKESIKHTEHGGSLKSRIQTAIISLYSINWLVFITEMESVYCAVRAGALYIVRYDSCVSNCYVPKATTACPQLCIPQRLSSHAQPAVVATPNSPPDQLSPPNCRLITFSHALYTAAYIPHKITKTNGVKHNIGIRNERHNFSLPQLKILRCRHVVINGCRKLKQQRLKFSVRCIKLMPNFANIDRPFQTFGVGNTRTVAYRVCQITSDVLQPCLRYKMYGVFLRVVAVTV